MKTATPDPLAEIPAARNQTMTAIAQDHYGTTPNEVLRLATVAKPNIGDHDILVRVRAASVDRGTLHLMTGLPYPVRFAGFGVRRPKALNPGRSMAGIVEAVGINVTEFAVGDQVYGTCSGSFAEYAVAQAGRLASKPANVSYEQAAAIPVSGLTALQGVRDHAKVQPGQKVLINGASGGVGTFAVQIAKAFGAEVTGVCSTAKVDLVRRLGADHVIDYTRSNITDGDRHYDVILDIGGNRRLTDLRNALTKSGTLVIIGGETGGRWLAGAGRQIQARLLSPLVKHKLDTFISSENARDLVELRHLVESGQLRPAIDRVYPLADVPTAIQYVKDGRARGKVVINV